MTRDGFSKFINEGSWGLKIFIILGLWIGTLFIKNEYFVYFSRFAQYASALYLFVQMVSIVDALYLWAEYWAEKYDNGNTCYGVLMVAFMFIVYALSITIMVYSFKYFWLEGCYGNKAILISLPIFLVLFTVLIILKFHPKG